MRVGAMVAALLAVIAGCAPDPAPAVELDPATTTVEFAFIDASVSPEIQRSFVLTAVDGTATVVVAGPDGEAARDEQPLAAGVIEDLVTAYNDGQLAETFAADPKAPCTGASSQRLTLDDGAHTAEVAFTYCGDNNGEARSQLTSAVAPLLEPFDMDTLTEGRYTG